ncbi:isochorismate synthase [Kocuria rhizophila]|uniref:isochorismate synthase n=1 Tax=Kocuria rhizophila TaxID=72000 RepID=A0AAX2SBF6_KOCRH|nr:isochorismate synthase [Kocuria rhizophila]TFH98848.1 isochorismate synthase [Kocuria rhizophila]TFI07671.1 isochorismate synthase [Kocuria rhizophila]
MTPEFPAPRLSALTLPLSDVPAASDFARDPDVRRLLGSEDPATWIVRGQGLVGLGRTAAYRVRGGTRFTSARVWWDAVREAARVTDEVRLPGTGLLAFGAFAFAPSSTVDSGLMVPELVVGTTGDTAWLTLVTTDPSPTVSDLDAAWRRLARVAPAGHAAPAGHDAAAPLRAETGRAASSHPTAVPGSLDEERWMAAVADGVGMIRAGELDKLVLARDVVVDTGADIDLGGVLGRLSERFDTCWTYCVRLGEEGSPCAGRLLGATPEMLIRVHRGTATARVLAGTLDRQDLPEGANPEDFAGTKLGGSEKQQREHRFAVDSLVAGLSPYADEVSGGEHPFILALPNVWHLASDVTAQLRTGVDGTLPSALELAEAVHPTAAVCGTPTETAGAVIEDLERMDRGLYAGPVGWLDGAGNGEWGIALRGAVQLDGHRARVSAGCGIVAESDPRAELAETWAKLRPMLESLPARSQG